MDPVTLTGDQIAVLRAVAEAQARFGEATTIDVAFVLGRTRPELLNTRRERLMTQLRRAGAIELVRSGGTSSWRLSDAGRTLLSGLPT